jgi:hypothetical protein
MVLIFKTSVSSIEQVKNLTPFLNKLLDGKKWNFDLEDCDHIFRVESDSDMSLELINELHKKGFDCELL